MPTIELSLEVLAWEAEHVSSSQARHSLSYPLQPTLNRQPQPPSLNLFRLPSVAVLNKPPSRSEQGIVLALDRVIFF
jgi:hypothetical protein|uniref:Uncharacterized protein n=1 Tax=Picea glauca TaxID=3330 RepID=A0A124GP93_PICGL|nr:hypothetical protein ABT39_MTgene1120 [Picea glauca]QHR87763.1 hypothetical protein Q903MT_gene1775 [Picea sitchensis]